MMFDSDDWVQQHRNRIRELEAALAKVTAERDEAVQIVQEVARDPHVTKTRDWARAFLARIGAKEMR